MILNRKKEKINNQNIGKKKMGARQVNNDEFCHGIEMAANAMQMLNLSYSLSLALFFQLPRYSAFILLLTFSLHPSLQQAF